MLVASSAAGWIPAANEAQTVLWVWIGVVVVYALWRSVARPDPDPLRPSGPVF